MVAAAAAAVIVVVVATASHSSSSMMYDSNYCSILIDTEHLWFLMCRFEKCCKRAVWSCELW